MTIENIGQSSIAKEAPGLVPLALMVLLLEGFITISIEILTIRQLAPFYGNSVVITSVIIGFFLLFLALGYYKGGLYRSDYFNKLTKNYCLSLLWIGIGLSYIFIGIFSRIMLVHLNCSYLTSLILYLILVLAPIVYWLGQTIPITTNLFNQSSSISRISGLALFLSTTGSFLGALVTSLVLFQYLGVAWAVVINCFLLITLVLLLSRFEPFTLGKFLFLGFSLVFIKYINVNAESFLFKLTNNYANYELQEKENGERIFRINESNSSFIDKNKKGYPFVGFIQKILFKDRKVKNQDVLIIGAGGFSLTALGLHDNRVTYLDIDPAIKDVAEKYFLKEAIKGNFLGEDARSFLNHSKDVYDVIISDAYSNINAIPPSLLTVEYFSQLAQHLKPNGLAVLNIIANPWFENDYSKRVDNSIRKVFSYCSVSPITWDGQWSNMIYVCENSPRDLGVYRDNLSTATFDYFKQSLVESRP